MQLFIVRRIIFGNQAVVRSIKVFALEMIFDNVRNVRPFMKLEIIVIYKPRNAYDIMHKFKRNVFRLIMFCWGKYG